MENNFEKKISITARLGLIILCLTFLVMGALLLVVTKVVKK